MSGIKPKNIETAGERNICPDTKPLPIKNTINTTITTIFQKKIYTTLRRKKTFFSKKRFVIYFSMCYFKYIYMGI